MRHKHSLLIIGLGLLLLCCIFFLENTAVISNYVSSLNLIPKAEAFTELYFKNPSSLPNAMSPDQQYHFTFVIHNVEQQDITYLYEVSVEEDNQNKQVLEDNYVSVNNDAYKEIPVTFGITNSFQKTKVTVRLVNMNQQIAFWIKGSQ